MMRRSGLDLRIYGEAIPLLVRTPALFLAPLLAGVVDVFIQIFSARTGTADSLGGITGGLLQLLIFLLDSFGLAVSLIIADRCWRRGRGTFDEGWEEARRRAPEIFMAAIGLNFILIVAGQVGSFISGYLGLALSIVAFVFMIYTLPAAAIGGIPGVAALNVSIERVRADFPTAIALSVCFMVLYVIVGMILVPTYTLDLGAVISPLLGALVRAIALGYFALVLAKGYETVSYR